MKFSKEFLTDGLYGAAIISDEITGQSRWSTMHRRIFKHEDKFYETCYSAGSTEIQDESMYENDDDDIECVEVFPVEAVIVIYARKESK